MQNRISKPVRVVALLFALNIIGAGALFGFPGIAFANPPDSAGENPVNAPPLNEPPKDAPPLNEPPADAPPVDAPPKTTPADTSDDNPTTPANLMAP